MHITAFNAGDTNRKARISQGSHLQIGETRNIEVFLLCQMKRSHVLRVEQQIRCKCRYFNVISTDNHMYFQC